ncbi:ras GTPase-activating protein-binding protein 1 [Agrilus planipennis]|uniref:Ras GTPase-activating protein-binding protein 1 n=1 Tax=Agrilus planipennis TaxID=224129 RepID=A0A1W4WT60_AGRPL|nr:ras GTPase-activating protein-binding protein 1 [Agrilus planipennis]
MVMEAPPSPQSVGREFVRQYYTLLNRAPTHLHRFYNNQSSFVHGGLDPPNRETSPMVGQKQIHQKIQQLNFRDCHAKITQVDAQATLGNGVVVQVTGELSNAGQPMRRFTQTFVLAAQSPKKYYVHNDIFRYQDEIVSDDECEPENRSENEDDLNQDRQVGMGDVAQISPQPIPTYYSPNTPLQSNIPPVPQHHAQPPPVISPQPPIPAVNGVVHPDDLPVISGQVPQPHIPSSGQTQGLGTPMGALQATGMIGNATAPPMPVAPVDEPQQPLQQLSQLSEEETITNTAEQLGTTDFNESSEVTVEESQEPPLESAASSEPKTYATLLKSGGGVTGSNVTPTSNYINPPPKSLSPPLIQNRYESRDFQSGSTNSTGPRNNGSVGNNGNGTGTATNYPLGGQQAQRGPRRSQQQGIPRQDSQRTGSGGQPGRNSFNDDNFNFEDRRKSQNSHNDSNQLFLGNLPHTAREEEIREIFAQFGTIVDLRILSKQSKQPGIPGARAPPNYGFITYESQEAVQNCLAAKPLHYPHNDKTGVTLNVEEKKVKDRPSYGSGNRIGSGADNSGSIQPRPRDNGSGGGIPRRGPGGSGGPGGPRPGSSAPGGGGRTNSFNRGPSGGGGGPNRGSGGSINNTYNSRR